VRLFSSHDEFDAYLASPEFVPPVDGITLLQEYVRAAQPFITRAEIVGGAFVYAITADTGRGGFELCPADACAVDQPAGAPATLFALRQGFGHPIIARYEDFARRHGIEIAGFEFIETADGRMVTYDVNTTTNYNAQIEAVAPRPALPEVAAFLRRLLAQERGGQPGQRRPAATLRAGQPRPAPGSAGAELNAVRVLDADLRRVAAQRQRRGHDDRLALYPRPGRRQ
jgi:hypothetical protein